VVALPPAATRTGLLEFAVPGWQSSIGTWLRLDLEPV